MDWQDATRQILERLNLKAEYAALGVRLAADKPTPSGWLSCYVFAKGGNGESDPSAGVNVAGPHPQLGRYKEFTGESRNVSFFEFAAAVAGQYKTWQEAREHYAKQAGVKLPATAEQSLNLVLRDYNARQVAAWCQLRPPISEEAARLAGVRMAGWPAADQRFTVVAMPVYGVQLTDDDPIGWTIWNKTGLPLPYFGKRGEKPKPVKMLNAGGSQSGWMNRFALAHIDQAEIVWKVEGPGDCLALQTVIPEDLRAKHIVITNSSGSLQVLPDDFWDMLAGKTIYVVHDCDRDGQAGGTKQATRAAAVAGVVEVRHLTLPYPIEPKHGQDVRDWLNDGHTYQELLAMATAAPIVAAPEPLAGVESTEEPRDSMEHDKSTCESIGLDVLGERPNAEILVYAQGKLSVIPKISRLTHNDLLQIAGPAARDRVHPGGGDSIPVGMVPFGRMQQAIAILAGQQRLRDQTTRGEGIWRGSNGELVLVGGGESALWRPRAAELERVTHPKAAGLLLEMDGGEPWYDFRGLQNLLKEATDAAWRRSVLDETAEILGRWRWQTGPGASTLLVGVILASWVQTAWRWRPHVALTGESAAGKSTFLEVLSGLFGRLGFLSSKPSEAGLRQLVRNRACVILIDEFESDWHRRKVLDLLRTSSTGSRIPRGTPGQGGIEYGLRHICWVSAIEIGTDRQPDRNRYLTFEMLPPKIEAIRAFRLPVADDLRALGQRLLAVAIWCFDAALDLAGRLRSHQLDGFDPRTLESLAVPASMLAVAMGMEADAEAMQALEFCAAQIEQDRRHHEPDQVQLMHAILSSSVPLGHGRIMSVAQLLAASASDFPGDAWDSLERVGIAAAAESHAPREFASNRDVLFLEPRAIARYLLAGTIWADQSIDQLLLRLPTARRNRRRFGNLRAWGIELSYQQFAQQFLADADDEQVDSLL